ncbi:hypothetical protein SCALIN_C10_0131 [Candidatus Scalindua japonica]|uniref:Ice-binding protein C-terminal domain-containing protein n=2 Tax=Candidatus Scalindua japonica TaxID=1284222 RepID=A0A286TX07_9BACT|nr:hypothetical protein SCALIN_C10_0131 [Candidatus Scalindua japonica]
MKAIMIVIITTLTVILFLGREGKAFPIEDQVNDDRTTTTPTIFNADGVSHNWQQGVTTGIAGVLVSIDLFLEEGTTSLYINKGAPWETDKDEYNGIITGDAGWGWQTIDLTASNISLALNETFVIGIKGIGGGLRSEYNTNVPEYAGGSLYYNGNPWLVSNSDMLFRTFMEPNSVPEPTTVTLLGIGLVGLAAAIVRRRLKKTRF